MFETLPQHPQHPQSFQLFQQQQHQQDAYLRTPWMPASPSPLGLCSSSSSNTNVNTFSHAGAVFAGKNMGGSADKENHNICKGSAENTRKTTTSTTSTATTPTNPRPSTYEQRFKSAAASSRPFARIFGSAPTQSSPTTSPPSSSSSAISAAAAARSTRQRALFLDRVKQKRDTARFNARGDSLMMMEHLSEQRDWHEAMRRHADAIFQELRIEEEDKDDESDDNDNNHNSKTKERDMGMDMDMDAEQYALALQEQEMEALLENMPVDNRDDTAASQDCSFSDEEIDHLFDQIAGDCTQDMDMSG